MSEPDSGSVDHDEEVAEVKERLHRASRLSKELAEIIDFES